MALIWLLPTLVNNIKVTVLTWYYGDTLSEVALQFREVTSAQISGTQALYYCCERPKFPEVATGEALLGVQLYWDGFYQNQDGMLYLTDNYQFSKVRVLEYTDDTAILKARITWRQVAIDRVFSSIRQEVNAGATTTFWLVAEDGVWKVSAFESAP